MLAEEGTASEDAPIRSVREDRGQQSAFTRMTILIGLVIVALLLLTVLLAVALTNNRTKSSLASLVQVQNIFAHLTALSNLAYTYSNGTRAVGTVGFNMTGEYIMSQLKAAGYTPAYQYFSVPTWSLAAGTTPTLTMTTPFALNFILNSDFVVMGCSPSGALTNVQAQLIPDYGCDASNYTDFVAGNVAIVRRGICTTFEKIANATAAGASAIIIFQNLTSYTTPWAGRADCTLFGVNTAPVFGATASFGQLLTALLSQGVAVNVTLAAEGVITNTTAFNVIAETTEGNPNRTIVIGAHCDSVPAGPGMNDNGSGTSTLLETAIQLKKHAKFGLKNRVRFCWWGAEELGLLGSEHYVSQLTPAEISQIAMNLNFDMLASPNWFRGVYNATSTIYPAVLNGSLTLQYLLEDAFNMTPMDGRSDYVYFNSVGIPSTGFFTGAEVLKTEEFRELYGGLANTPYDPCYHQACDNLSNIDQDMLAQSARLIADVLQRLATNPSLAEAVAANAPPKRWY